MELTDEHREILRAAAKGDAVIARHDLGDGRVRIRTGGRVWVFGPGKRPVLELEAGGLVKKAMGSSCLYFLTPDGIRAAESQS